MQNKMRDYLKSIFKANIIIVFLFFTSFSVAQDFTGKQSEVWDLLQNYRMYKPKREIGYINSGRFNIEDYQHPLIKARLLEVLQNPPLTTAEIDSWVEGKIATSLKFQAPNFDEMAAKMAASTGKPYTEIRDSLDQATAAYSKMITLRNLESENRKVDKDVVLMCGWLDMQEAVPYLKQALQDSLVYDPFFVKMALARLQVEPYYSDMIDWLTDKDVLHPLRYLHDPQAYEARIQSLFYIATPLTMRAVGKIVGWEGTYRVNPEGTLEQRTSLLLLDMLRRRLSNQKQYITEEAFVNFSNILIVNGMDVLSRDFRIYGGGYPDSFFKNAAQWIEENFGKFNFNRYDPYTKEFPIDDDY